MHQSSDTIRAAFSNALSAMYRQEVPLYADLLDIVRDVNEATLTRDPRLEAQLESSGETSRLGEERHGAIRVGTPEELAGLRRAFRVMGMHPVGYYDLSVAGVPVHSTAFRPITHEALAACPFRVFTSLLRLELIADDDLRADAARILATRSILSDRAMRLIEAAEADGGLVAADAEEFVAEVLNTFRWQSSAIVDAATYTRLLDAHRLVADIVSFRGPHINHLTPRTLDIDRAQEAMVTRGLRAKDVIEGPPRRHVPILLRQTSFNALQETISFTGQAAGDVGVHTARFGEIEQRGVALTREGRELYDSLLMQARGAEGAQGTDYFERLSRAFTTFPDDHQALRMRKLAFYRYEITPRGELMLAGPQPVTGDLEDWIWDGIVTAIPVTYEDFLPVSAAGIFQSNLGGGEQRSYQGSSSQDVFEQALGEAVLDPFALYEAIETRSREAVLARLAAVAA